MYSVYILYNKNKSFTYYGLTNNLTKRIKKHKSGKVRVTKGYLPLSLVWYCVFKEKRKAAAFEKYLKSGSGRAFVKKHII